MILFYLLFGAALVASFFIVRNGVKPDSGYTDENFNEL